LLGSVIPPQTHQQVHSAAHKSPLNLNLGYLMQRLLTSSG